MREMAVHKCGATHDAMGAPHSEWAPTSLTTAPPWSSQSWGSGGWQGVADPRAQFSELGSRNHRCGTVSTAEASTAAGAVAPASTTTPPDTRLSSTSSRGPAGERVHDPLQGAGDPWMEAAQRLTQAATAGRATSDLGSDVQAATIWARCHQPV